MPIYKGSTEVTSGNLRKGSTNIENGYKETSPFYTNTNGITINFIDAISGATMSTTQFSSVGVPGASFSSFSRTITTDSGRIFSGTVSVAEAGDGGNNVSASISGQGSTTATLNVSGTYPTTGTTVTLTVNGATQVQLPNLVVTQNGNYPLTTTGDGGAIGTYNYSISNSADCVGGSSGSGSTSGSGSSDTYYSYSRPSLAGGPYGNGCGMTCNSSFTSSKSGYNSGSTTFSSTGSNPNFSNNYYWSPSGGFPSGSYNPYGQPQTCGGACPSCSSCTGTCTSGTLLVAQINAVAGGPAWRIGGGDYSSYTVATQFSATNGQTFTNSINPTNIVWPSNFSMSLTNQGNKGNGYVTGITGTINYTNPNSSTRGGFYYTVTGTGSSGGSCGGGQQYIGQWSSGTSKTFNATCGGNMSGGTYSLSIVMSTSSPNLTPSGFGTTSWTL